MKIITGRRTILFPLLPSYYDYGEKLATNDKSLRLGTCPVVSEGSFYWLAKTKEGRATRNIGIIGFNITSNTAVALRAIFDPMFAVNIEIEIKRRYTFLEDALHTALDYVLGLEDIYRVEIPLFPEDKTGLLILDKAGFIEEGRMRSALKIDGHLKDIVVLSKIKGDVLKMENPVVEKKPEPVNTEPDKEMSDEELAKIGIIRINRKEE